jgi:hypothetical protein
VTLQAAVFARADHVAPLFAINASPPPTVDVPAANLIEYVEPASELNST